MRACGTRGGVSLWTGVVIVEVPIILEGRDASVVVLRVPGTCALLYYRAYNNYRARSHPTKTVTRVDKPQRLGSDADSCRFDSQDSQEVQATQPQSPNATYLIVPLKYLT